MFITATCIVYPVNPKETSQPNFSKNRSNFIADEVVAFVRNLRDTDRKQANVILDTKKLTVVKCRDFQINGNVVSDPDYKILWDYFYASHPTELDIVLKANAISGE